ncbi:HIT family protein [Kitasatospora sp. NBC_00240]|uniref:HIT family protein n=1 Tax=Kitasatospora sp. NBC_00240 TaxID=2903567 RepID=UPI002252E84B|nr:HIT family protein [Kitasatospora sp. NBC_00240]MCX5211855.1 HIT family protein [Kitasatospora sp. NBC_00240]
MSTSTWPADWEDRKAGLDCPMCATRGMEDNGHGLRILHGAFADVYLNRAALPGYAMAIWNGPHVAEPTQLDEDQAAGFFREMLLAARAVESHFNVVKMNYEVLGNSVPHLHVHLIPRYDDDPAPGSPLPTSFLRPGHPADHRFLADADALRGLLA